MRHERMDAKKRYSESEAQSYTTSVEEWWNSHPFTLGLGTDHANDLTGRVPDHDRFFFREVERKMRKWWRGATYDDPNEPLLSKFIAYPGLQGKRVLDIAVGTGWSVVAFAKAGADVYGIDLTDEAVLMTKKHTDIEGVTADIRRMDAQDLAFPDASFDFVLAWGCYMHMPDTEKALRETGRVLKDGGGHVAYWYSRSSWTYWFNFFFLRGILLGYLVRYRGNMTRLVSRFTDGSAQGGNMLTKAYSPRELVRMYTEAGFSSVKVVRMPLDGEVEGWPMATFPVFRYLPSRVREWMGKRMAWGLVVTAIK